MDFTWTMNENEWKRLKDIQKSKKYDLNDYFGSCYVGGICCDFQHTMDPGDWYAFVNLFYVKDNTTYGKLKDGTKYDLHYGSPVLPIKCETFESFKKRFEKLFEKYINEHDELKCLTERKASWCVFQ